MANVLDPEWNEEREGNKRSRIGRQAGAERIGVSLWLGDRVDYWEDEARPDPGD